MNIRLLMYNLCTSTYVSRDVENQFLSFDFFKVNNLQMEVFHIDNTSVNKVHDPLTMEPSKLRKTGCNWNLKILTTNHKLL